MLLLFFTVDPGKYFGRSLLVYRASASGSDIVSTVSTGTSTSAITSVLQTFSAAADAAAAGIKLGVSRPHLLRILMSLTSIISLISLSEKMDFADWAGIGDVTGDAGGRGQTTGASGRQYLN